MNRLSVHWMGPCITSAVRSNSQLLAPSRPPLGVPSIHPSIHPAKIPEPWRQAGQEKKKRRVGIARELAVLRAGASAGATFGAGEETGATGDSTGGVTGGAMGEILVES
jgi:hypothetical protein